MKILGEFRRQFSQNNLSQIAQNLRRLGKMGIKRNRERIVEQGEKNWKNSNRTIWLSGDIIMPSMP